MKFEEIFISLLAEQDNDEHGVHGFDDGEFAGEGPEIPQEPEEPQDPDQPEQPQQQQQPRPEPPKKLSRSQMIRIKWKGERPGLTDQEVTDAMDFFNERKDRLKPYKPYGTVINGRFWVNLPEITALVQRFPDMEAMLSNEVQMKDMGNYTWDQIQFYMNRIFNQAIQFDDENFVKGDYTEDQRIEWALDRWKSTYNRVFNENNIVAFRVDCKSESIALGALDHAIWRKYNIDNLADSTRRRLTFEKDGVIYNGGIHPEILQKIRNSYRWGGQPWCVARPIGGLYGANLWTSYRPQRAFYFVLDNNRPEWDEHHIVALQATERRGQYIITTMPNNGDHNYSWNEVIDIFPGLRGHQEKFLYFGTTPRETKELTLDAITFTRGHPNDFAIQPDAVHRTYIENNRHIRDKRCFLTLSFENRKLYIDKASKENNDYKQRFICDNPEGEPLAILEILRNEKTKDGNLYKYLDEFKLKTLLQIPEGVIAIKKSIAGSNYRTLYTDSETSYTLYSTKEERTRHLRSAKYGVMNINTFEWIKNVEYIETKPMSFLHLYSDENGVQQRKIYTMQRYSKSIQGQEAETADYFYFLYLTKDVVNRTSPNYMKGRYFEGRDGDTFLREKIDSGAFRKI